MSTIAIGPAPTKLGESWIPPGRSKRAAIRRGDHVRFPGARRRGIAGRFVVRAVRVEGSRVFLDVAQLEDGQLIGAEYSLLVWGKAYWSRDVKVLPVRVQKLLAGKS